MIVLMEMMLFLFSTVLKPMDSLSLAKEFTLIRNYDGRLYFAPFIGKSIFLLDENERLQPITFTDDRNQRKTLFTGQYIRLCHNPFGRAYHR